VSTKVSNLPCDHLRESIDSAGFGLAEPVRVDAQRGARVLWQRTGVAFQAAAIDPSGICWIGDERWADYLARRAGLLPR
jgi:hypothetical protein